MKLRDFTNSLTSLETAALIVFVIYIIFPFRTPAFLSSSINNPLGLISVLIVTLYLFFYTNPILGVVYIFVAYELLRRSALVKAKSDNYIINYTPSEKKRTQEMIDMNPDREISLEETVIATLAPSQVFNSIPEGDSTYQPVKEKVSASLYK